MSVQGLRDRMAAETLAPRACKPLAPERLPVDPRLLREPLSACSVPGEEVRGRFWRAGGCPSGHAAPPAPDDHGVLSSCTCCSIMSACAASMSGEAAALVAATAAAGADDAGSEAGGAGGTVSVATGPEGKRAEA
jgi:hypothetical protein